MLGSPSWAENQWLGGSGVGSPAFPEREGLLQPNSSLIRGALRRPLEELVTGKLGDTVGRCPTSRIETMFAIKVTFVVSYL